MDRGKGNERESGIGKAKNSSRSSDVLCNDIVKLLDFVYRFNNTKELTGRDKTEKLKFSLTTMLRYFQFPYSNIGYSNDIMLAKSDEVKSRDDMNNVLLNILYYICIRSYHPKSGATITEEQLVGLLDSLVMKLHLLSTVESIFPTMNQYVALQNVCGSIRDFHALKVNGCIESDIVDYVIPQFQLMAESVEHFCLVLLAHQLYEFVHINRRYFLYQVNNVTAADLLVKIIPIELEVMHICHTNLKASKSTEVGHFIQQLLQDFPDILREYLIHLEDVMVNVTSVSTSTPKIHVMIEFLLIILTDKPKNFIHHDKIFDLFACVGEVTKEVLFLVRNLEDKSRNEESNDETDCAILDLVEHIELLKGDHRYIYLKDPGPSELRFNMIDRSLFMNLLLSNLNDLLSSNAYSVALINKEIGLLKEDLEFIRVFFGNNEQELHEDLWKRSLDLAYEINYAINSILSRDNGLFHLVFSLPNAIEKIKFIKEEVSNLPEKIPKNRGLIIVNSPRKLVENKSSPAGKIIVGLKEETDWIIRKLTQGPAELDVISIIGMPGLGKTTLAYKVYNDRSVISHFDIRAWCTVDQQYKRKMILQSIFNQVTGSDEKFKEDTDVDDVLRKKLYGRRCLIVLDDLWDTATWDDLTRPFHQVEKGSRIILTSRKKEVALHGKRHSDPLNLRLLRLEESWELLEKRVFGEESCPVELLDVGKDIAQNCKGLPLVVDLVSGVIARREKEKIVWLELLKDLKSFIFKDEVEVMRVIQLSYDHLLDNLKLCFLYLGSYRKDKEIEVNELKALWSAEGFVEEIEMKSMEEVMDEYLDHLVSSSLVMVSKGKFGKNVCQIHDLVHDFCEIKSGKEKLFDLITSSSPSFPSSDLMPRQVSVHYDEHLPQSCKDIILLNSEKERDSSCKHLLSLKITGDWEGNLIFHLRHLRLLRVLNLELCDLPNYLLNEIGMLVHLRYLKIRTDNIGALPSSFSNLWNLETLVVNNKGVPMELEPVIWNLVKLRYVAIKPCHFSHLGTDEPILLREDSKLENMRTLETLQLYGSKGHQDILKRLPNLRKLDCEIVKDYSAGCDLLAQFGFLKELEELKIFDVDGVVSFEARDRSDFPLFPPSIKFLELNCASLTSDSLSTITRLPNLQELHLINIDILGGEWNMQEDDTFENLKILEVYWGFFSKWQVREESFPVLEHLILRFLVQFKEIPSSFGDIDSLKSIELVDSSHLEESALEIKQYVEEITGEDKLLVLVRKY